MNLRQHRRPVGVIKPRLAHFTIELNDSRWISEMVRWKATSKGFLTGHLQEPSEVIEHNRGLRKVYVVCHKMAFVSSWSVTFLGLRPISFIRCPCPVVVVCCVDGHTQAGCTGTQRGRGVHLLHLFHIPAGRPGPPMCCFSTHTRSKCHSSPPAVTPQAPTLPVRQRRFVGVVGSRPPLARSATRPHRLALLLRAVVRS